MSEYCKPFCPQTRHSCVRALNSLMITSVVHITDMPNITARELCPLSSVLHASDAIPRDLQPVKASMMSLSTCASIGHINIVLRNLETISMLSMRTVYGAMNLCNRLRALSCGFLTILRRLASRSLQQFQGWRTIGARVV